jgi:hypothetical protein
MDLHAWLQRFGFSGHPFACKQADDEGDQLGEYFVAHPSYTQILDADTPRSSILHAPRGAGKSSTRRMFEQFCRSQTGELRPLLIYLTDWMPVANRVRLDTVVPPEQHFHELVRHLVVALARDSSPWLHAPAFATQIQLLAWLCKTYGDYLSSAEQDALAARGWPLDIDPESPPPAFAQLPLRRRLELLIELIKALGYGRCYVLIDGIDELFETATNWVAGANLIEGLVANLALVEVRGLAFKFFIPSEIVAELRSRRRLRVDRLSLFELEWSPELLLELLSRRLAAFNDHDIRWLAQMADPSLAQQIDECLVRAAGHSPRLLLNLGDWLFVNCAHQALDNDLFIHRDHLMFALRHRRDHLLDVEEIDSDFDADLFLDAALVDPREPHLTRRFRLGSGGEIWLGDQLLADWVKLSKLQRRFLDFLYANRHRLCSKEEIIAHVWADRQTPADDDSLRKLMDRVIDLIEEDTEHPQYFQKVPGFVRLMNTVD